MPHTISTVWAGEALTLFWERALYWPRTQTLLIADSHFGKAATFRSAGIPVPHGTTEADLMRLDLLLDGTGARRLLILGDFFHASAGRSAGSSTMQTLEAWRERRPELEIVIVRGNHDRHAGDPPPAWNMRVVPATLIEPPFVFCHDCQTLTEEFCAENPDLKTVSGHIHPAVRLRDVTGSTLQVPCFHFGRRGGLLPAFGSFTGQAVIRPQAGDQVFILGPDEILEIPNKRAA